MTAPPEISVGDLVEVTYVDAADVIAETGHQRRYRGLVVEVGERLVVQVTERGTGPVEPGTYVAPYNHLGPVDVRDTRRREKSGHARPGLRPVPSGGMDTPSDTAAIIEALDQHQAAIKRACQDGTPSLRREPNGMPDSVGRCLWCNERHGDQPRDLYQLLATPVGERRSGIRPGDDEAGRAGLL